MEREMFKSHLPALNKANSRSSSDSDSSSSSHSNANADTFTLPTLSRATSASNDVEEEGEFTSVRATCHCGRSAMRVHFYTAALPISTSICNCNSCRHNTGQLGSYTVKIVGVPLELGVGQRFASETLAAYQPPDRHGVTRYFCSTCSAHVLIHVDLKKREQGDNDRHPGSALGYPGSLSEDETADEEWRVAGGALVKAEGIIQPVYHLNINSTMDGGLADQLPVVNGIELVRFSEGIGSPQLPLGWRSPLLKDAQAPELAASCHCGAVSFKISRPQAIASVPRAAYPDLIYPLGVTRLAKQCNLHDEKWWLCPPMKEDQPIRYLAGHCACNYCRMMSGFEVQSWGFVARAHLKEKDSDEPIEFFDEELRPKGLKQYLSSPGRYSEFCGTCGATAFWWSVGRADVVDVSIALIDQDQDGARAEHWFAWHKERVSHSETAPSQSIVQGLIEGLKRF